MSADSVLQQQHSDLSRFAQEFRDEDHLRTVLRDLLLRTGARRVRVTHGPGERGKDLVFYKTGGLSPEVMYACVVKKDRITGRADSSGGPKPFLTKRARLYGNPTPTPALESKSRLIPYT